MKNKIEIKFSYTESNANYDTVKSVELTTYDDDMDDVLGTFIEFSRSIGMEIKLDYTTVAGPTAH